MSLQAADNNSVKMCDEFLHGRIVWWQQATAHAVTFWPFCLPNLSVKLLCPEVACCFTPIIYSSTTFNLSIHFLFSVFVENLQSYLQKMVKKMSQCKRDLWLQHFLRGMALTKPVHFQIRSYHYLSVTLISFLPSTSHHWSRQPVRFCLLLCNVGQNIAETTQKVTFLGRKWTFSPCLW